MTERFFVETLGCPKNQVDSDKLAGSLLAEGLEPAAALGDADLVVVNTCAFIVSAREESIEAILDASRERREGARLVVTGCLAARAGAALATALPEVDSVVDIGLPVHVRGPSWRPRGERSVSIDFLDLPRPPARAPWAYVKVADGCDRRCGFCAIPLFRGPQRSRPMAGILAEIDALGAAEIVLVAQDLASYGRDLSQNGTLIDLAAAAAARVLRLRLLYLYPSSLDDRLVDAIVATGVPYFDLSLQHVSRPLLRRMRRFGSAETFLGRIEKIRSRAPEAALRSSFILGYPGETETDHDALLEFLPRGRPRLGWVLHLLRGGRNLRHDTQGQRSRAPRARAPPGVRRTPGRHHSPEAARPRRRGDGRSRRPGWDRPVVPRGAGNRRCDPLARMLRTGDRMPGPDRRRGGTRPRGIAP